MTNSDLWLANYHPTIDGAQTDSEEILAAGVAGSGIVWYNVGWWQGPSGPTGDGTMTEADENTLRVLLSEVRETDPERFLEIVVNTLVARAQEDSIQGFTRDDNDGITDSLVVVYRGYRVAGWAEKSLRELEAQLEQAKAEDTWETGSSEGEPG